MHKKLLVVTGLFLVNLSLNAQEMVTDRPDQTESSSVVPLGRLQVETGFVWEQDNMGGQLVNYYHYNSTLLRWGIMENVEIRFGQEYLDVQKKDAQLRIRQVGWSPSQVGMKIALAEEKSWRPEMAMIGQLTLPWWGDDDYRPDYLAPSFVFAFSHSISDIFSLGYNLGAEWDGTEAQTSLIYSLVLGASPGSRVGLFVEMYGDVNEDYLPRHYFDSGITLLLFSDFQLDLSGGVALNKEGTDAFLSSGVTWRF